MVNKLVYNLLTGLTTNLYRGEIIPFTKYQQDIPPVHLIQKTQSCLGLCSKQDAVQILQDSMSKSVQEVEDLKKTLGAALLQYIFSWYGTPLKTHMTGLKNPPWMKMYFLLKLVIFQCHVSFQGCT